MWTQAADLFADDGEYEIDGRGTFIGKKRVLSYLRGIGTEFPQAGRLYDQMQLQPIVHVAPDGKSARGRWRIFSQAAQAGKVSRMGRGHCRERLREGPRRVEDPQGALLSHDVHALRGWLGQDRADSTSSFEPALTPDRTGSLRIASRSTVSPCRRFTIRIRSPARPCTHSSAAEFARRPAGCEHAAPSQKAARRTWSIGWACWRISSSSRICRCAMATTWRHSSGIGWPTCSLQTATSRSRCAGRTSAAPASDAA